MSYITESDIKADFTTGIDLSDYISRADSEIIDLAERKGVRNTDDISTPIHYKIKEYIVSWVLMQIALDSYGTNAVDTTYEKYRDLYDIYKTRVNELYPQITYEMITGNVDSLVSRACVFNLYRT